MEKNERICYVPIDISVEKEYFQGFGKKELKRCTKYILISIIITAVLIASQHTIAGVVISVLGIGGSVSFMQRARGTNISMADEILNIIRFKRLPKIYYYRYHGIKGERVKK